MVLAHAVSDKRVDDRYKKPGSIIRHGYTITPNATYVIERLLPAHLYFEVYGVSLDSLGLCAYDIHVNMSAVGE